MKKATMIVSKDLTEIRDTYDYLSRAYHALSDFAEKKKKRLNCCV